MAVAVTTETLSELLRSALDSDHDGRVSLGEVADRVAERGYGLFLIMLSLPMLVPMPPGASGPVGLLLALLGVQLFAGRPHPWLPERVRNYKLPARVVTAMQKGGVAFLQKIEKLSRPRWEFMENPLSLRIAALLIVLLGLILFLPIPGMNSLPALFLLLVGVGMLNRDGVFLLLGTSLCGLLVMALIVAAVMFWDKVVRFVLQHAKWPW